MPTSLLGKMSVDLLTPEYRLDRLIESAPHRYKVYQIPKQSGTGSRTIAQPAKEIKRLQYWVINNIFPDLPVHSSATAYVAGKNILNNSEVHSDNPYLLKLDFRDFFPSIKGTDFLKYSKHNGDISLLDDDLNRLVRLLFWIPKRRSDLQLSIGAPSSPFLSNAMMYCFDKEISRYCCGRTIAYTRYADDMTFSMHDKNMRGEVLREVESVLASQPFPSLELNRRKTVFGSKAHRRFVTGLILANNGTVSLGRERKRRIRAQIHHLKQNSLDDQEKSKLKGMLAFARDVEPDFVERMESKYGQQVLKDL